MLRLKNLANKYQKRTCRPVYANTQATPFAASLDDSFRSSGALVLPKNSSGTAGAGNNPSAVTRTADAFTSKNSLVPGLVLVKVAGSEKVTVAAGLAGTAERPFGLLANFVGGDLDEGFSGDSLQNEVGVWRGPDAVFEILAPAYDDTNMASTLTTNAGTATATPLYAQADGRLGISSGSSRTVVAYLLKQETNRILVDLAV